MLTAGTVVHMPRWCQELCAFAMLAVMVALAWLAGPVAIPHTPGTDHLASVGQNRLTQLTSGTVVDAAGAAQLSGLNLNGLENLTGTVQGTYWQNVGVGMLSASQGDLYETVGQIVRTDTVVFPLALIIGFGIVCSSLLIVSGAGLRNRFGLGAVCVGWRMVVAGALGATVWALLTWPVADWAEGKISGESAFKTAALIAVGAGAIMLMASLGYSHVLRSVAGKNNAAAPRSPANALLSLVLLVAGLGLGWWWWKTENAPVVKMMYVEIALVCAMLLARGVFRDVRRLSGNGTVEQPQDAFNANSFPS